MFKKHVEGIKPYEFRLHVKVLPEEYNWKVSVECLNCYGKTKISQTTSTAKKHLIFNLYLIKEDEKIERLIVRINPSDNNSIKRKWKLSIPSKGQTREGNFFNFDKMHIFNFGQFKELGYGLYLSIKVSNADDLENNEKYFVKVTGGYDLEEELKAENQTINDKIFKLKFSEKESIFKKIINFLFSGKTRKIKVCIYKQYYCEKIKGYVMSISKNDQNDHSNRYCNICKDKHTTLSYYDKKHLILPQCKTIINPILQNTSEPKFTYDFNLLRKEPEYIYNYVKREDIPQNDW